jgi:SAM-dependent methyltransferase
VSREPLLGPVERYYSSKVAEHGPVAAGVDWNSPESQDLRFRQVLKICDLGRRFSLNDIGCGYGALVAMLERLGCDFVYTGFDISPAMVGEARAAFCGSERVSFVETDDELSPADYSVASGIFNVKLDASDEAWQSHVLATLDRLHELSTHGFAFNMLTSYSDRHLMRPDLYYADPAFVFDHCKRRYSRHVALLHDYGLWEFTILVRVEPTP